MPRSLSFAPDKCILLPNFLILAYTDWTYIVSGFLLTSIYYSLGKIEN